MNAVQDLPVITRLLYAIVCSRGPGSETIVVRDLMQDVDDQGIYTHPRAVRHPREWMENANVHLNNRALTTMHEEGIVYALAADVTDHELWELVKVTEDHYDELANEEDEEVLKALTPGSDYSELCKQTSTNIIKSAPALRSAMLRAFLVPEGTWTSVNGWRNPEQEILTSEQIEKHMLFEQCLPADLATHRCAVLALSAQHYINGMSLEADRGC